jgi:hypothetical protein
MVVNWESYLETLTDILKGKQKDELWECRTVDLKVEKRVDTKAWAKEAWLEIPSLEKRSGNLSDIAMVDSLETRSVALLA